MSDTKRSVTRGFATVSLVGLALVVTPAASAEQATPAATVQQAPSTIAISAPGAENTSRLAENTSRLAEYPSRLAGWNYIDSYWFKGSCRNAGDRGKNQGLWTKYECRYGNWWRNWELWVWR